MINKEKISEVLKLLEESVLKEEGSKTVIKPQELATAIVQARKLYKPFKSENTSKEKSYYDAEIDEDANFNWGVWCTQWLIKNKPALFPKKISKYLPSSLPYGFKNANENYERQKKFNKNIIWEQYVAKFILDNYGNFFKGNLIQKASNYFINHLNNDPMV